MSANHDQAGRMIPAQISFLAIYNPSLGKRDESLREQIVFYSSIISRARRRCKHHSDGQDGANKEEENEELRQVGLAQGMVDFAKNFSDGESIDTIETEKSRTVIHEIEQDWWILASVDLTRLPSVRLPERSGDHHHHDRFEYSSREVSPAPLMIQHLLQAHSIFLLHHGTSLGDLYSRMPRGSFCTLLDRFWTRFVWNWNVLLHGNPAFDIYNGLKLAGGGELGIGVGEEEWGSGEREVLEDFIGRTEGLVDLIVSRFGDPPVGSTKTSTGEEALNSPEGREAPWLATELDPQPSDGVLFSGNGTISRRSMATVSQWMADIYRHGENAYGVGENPTGRIRRKRRRLSPGREQTGITDGRKINVRGNVQSPPRGRSPRSVDTQTEYDHSAPRIPPPLVKAAEQSLEKATAQASTHEPRKTPVDGTGRGPGEEEDSPLFKTDKMMKFLSLGYGSSWTLDPKGFSRSQSQPVPRRVSQLRTHERSKEQEANEEGSESPEPPQLDAVEPTPEVSDSEDHPFVQRLKPSAGKFLIGLAGDLENLELLGDDTAGSPRIALRTLTVEMHKPSSSRQASPPSTPGLLPLSNFADGESKDPFSASTHKQLQVAVYVHQPFIFTFLFDLHTPSLSYSSFYRNIHHQLGPLQTPLLRSTNPANVASRIANAMGEGTTTTTTTSTPSKNPTPPTIYDLIYDPEKLTIHGSIPNIPPPGSLIAEGQDPATQTVPVRGSWYTLGIPTNASSSSSNQHNWQTRSSGGGGSSTWTRMEALNVHTQILNTYSSTRRPKGEIERTIKTGRGWWVLWMRVQGRVNADGNDDENRGAPKEAVLVRMAMKGDGGEGGMAKGGRYGGGIGWWVGREQGRKEGSAGSNTAASGGGGGSGRRGDQMGLSSMSEGVGVDARRWVEGLLSLNR